MYKSLSEHYKEKFGCKVYKLSLNGGFTCPNRDGTLSNKGCSFCLNGSSDFAEKQIRTVEEQLERAKARVEKKNKNGKYIAYFSSFTSTYDKTERLKELYFQAISPDYIVGLSVSTRPDCINDEVIELFKEINKIKPVSVELGLQTVHDKTAEYINRCYPTSLYYEVLGKLKNAGIETVTHIILGLPFENEEMIKETVQKAVESGTDGIKFHMLYICEGTPLAKEYKEGKFDVLTLEGYAHILKECLSLLNENTIVHRITGDGPKKSLIAPLWSADKKRVLNYLNSYLKKEKV